MSKRKHLMTLVLALSVGMAALWFVLPIGAVAPPPPANPDTYVVTLYKTELSSDGGTTWVTVFTNPAGQAVDLKNNPGNAFGNGSVPEGTYTAMRFEILNDLQYSCATVSPTIVAGHFSPYSAVSTTHQTVYFANTGSFTWSNDGSSISKAFPLPDPIRVVYNSTSRIVINFGVTNSLVNILGTWYLNPPIMTVSNIVVASTPPAGGFQGGQYYFVRQNIRFPVENVITPTRMTIQSGWGMISMSAPSSEGKGTFGILAANNSEHDRWIYTSGPLTQTNMGGQIVPVGNTMTGTYYADADGYINLLMPQSNGIIRGAMRNDGKVFIAIEVASPFTATTQSNQEVGYHMIYALKVESNTNGANLIGNYAYNGYGFSVTTAYNTAGLAPNYENYKLENGCGIGWVNATASAITSTETKNRIEIDRPLSPTEQTIYNNIATINYYTNTNTAVPVDANCKFTPDSGTWGALLNDRSIGIYAGATTSPDWTGSGGGVNYWEDHLEFGVALPLLPAGTYTKASVAGTYTFVFRRDYWNGSNVTALPDNEVALGRITLDGAGNATGQATICRRGTTQINTFTNVTYTVITDKIGAFSSTAVAGTDYRFADVISLYDNVKQEEIFRMLIGSDGKTLSPYVPAETIPASGIANARRGLGLAVKQK